MKTQTKDKIALLKENFFPRMKEVDLSDLQDYIYPDPVDWPPFTLREVQVALSSVATRKAPGPDGISNLLEIIYEQCKKWEEKHASKFNPKKFKLIHLLSKYSKITDKEHPVWLDGREVKPVPKCRILGLIIDNKLNWNGHIEHIETKMTKSLGALSSLAGSTWGTGYKGLRQVYQAIILP
ncbi:hypothetical protein TSTA_023410 [Talaromyces stipitatus ATCC 10500]|uniref:Reverse transcriptase n=1 Tax=Talaromyces stipitatus (strain ATCC 10500 / CBS 375.48 / QM 6759 / NRRL 1006) TaxID=441959 RepID=B8M606_TALSN|nr:uncharacterized protein TSTA_023410 [Talaromyces stipitatus ATCC 10500]EED19006.1 hypothetical protein TSTA_023410 [Talaromyces stipitatus ATCC 10500]